MKHDGQPIRLSFEACRIHMGGEFSGNVDLDIRCDANLLDSLLDRLRLQVPGQASSELPIACGEPESGVELTFGSQSMSELQAAPRRLTLIWDDEPIAALEPTLADAVALEERFTFIDPAQILGVADPAIAEGAAAMRAVDADAVRVKDAKVRAEQSDD